VILTIKTVEIKEDLHSFFMEKRSTKLLNFCGNATVEKIDGIIKGIFTIL